jgi:hypothetical protein
MRLDEFAEILSVFAAVLREAVTGDGINTAPVRRLVHACAAP